MGVSATKWVYPATLKWAREQLGFSPDDVENLSKRLGKYYAPIQGALLQEWERGTSEPDLEHLETLSEIYVRPVGHFFLIEPPKESWPLSFRGISRDKEDKLSPQSRQTLRRFLELAEWTALMLEELGIKWDARSKPSRAPLDVEALVRQERDRLGYNSELRKSWAASDEAFLWWRRKVEEQGIFCFQMKLEPGDIRGASTWLENSYPFILVNHQEVEAATGRIFTLLHEYAHLITATDGLVCDFRGTDRNHSPEPFANQFAARMLISYNEVKQRLLEIDEYRYRGQWSDQLLDEIKKPFFVSRDVVAITLQEMELAPEGFYQGKRAQWDMRRPWGRGRGKGKTLTKRERKLRELGFSLSRILSRPDMANAIPATDLCYVLDMKVEKIQDFLSWARNEMSSG